MEREATRARGFVGDTLARWRVLDVPGRSRQVGVQLNSDLREHKESYFWSVRRDSVEGPLSRSEGPLGETLLARPISVTFDVTSLTSDCENRC